MKILKLEPWVLLLILTASHFQTFKPNNWIKAFDCCWCLWDFVFGWVRRGNFSKQNKIFFLFPYERFSNLNFQDSENLFLPFCVPQKKIQHFKEEIEKILKLPNQGSQLPANAPVPKSSRGDRTASTRMPEFIKILGNAPSDVRLNSDKNALLFHRILLRIIFFMAKIF